MTDPVFLRVNISSLGYVLFILFEFNRKKIQHLSKIMLLEWSNVFNNNLTIVHFHFNKWKMYLYTKY